MCWVNVSVAFVTGGLLCLVGCSDDGSGASMECLEPLDLECAPAFDPTYDQLFDRLLSSSSGCGVAGPNCHGAEGRQGMGLELHDRDQAYEMLLGNVDGRPRVIPKEPECSILIQRLESEDPAFYMPRGSQRLSEPQRCAFRLWVANGAERSE